MQARRHSRRGNGCNFSERNVAALGAARSILQCDARRVISAWRDVIWGQVSKIKTVWDPLTIVE